MPGTLESAFPSFYISNFLWGACPQSPLEKVAFGHLNSHSRLLLYGQTPTSNVIESPGTTIVTSACSFGLEDRSRIKLRSYETANKIHRLLITI